MAKLKNKLVPIYALNQYATDRSVLDDMDLANTISTLILEMLKIGKRPILDFKNISKIHPYWFVLAFYKYIIKFKGRVNEFIGVVNLTPNQLKLLNIVAKECQRNGINILNGIITSTLPDEQS